MWLSWHVLRSGASYDGRLIIMCCIITVPVHCGGNLKIIYTHTHTYTRMGCMYFLCVYFDIVSDLKGSFIHCFIVTVTKGEKWRCGVGGRKKRVSSNLESYKGGEYLYTYFYLSEMYIFGNY